MSNIVKDYKETQKWICTKQNILYDFFEMWKIMSSILFCENQTLTIRQTKWGKKNWRIQNEPIQHKIFYMTFRKCLKNYIKNLLL